MVNRGFRVGDILFLESVNSEALVRVDEVDDQGECCITSELYVYNKVFKRDEIPLDFGVRYTYLSLFRFNASVLENTTLTTEKHLCICLIRGILINGCNCGGI